MLNDMSNTNDSTGTGDNTTPQEQGYPGQYPPEIGIMHAREIYVVAYLRSLSDDLREAVEVVTEHLHGKLADADTLAARPVELWKEATRVILYTKDVYAGVYDRTPDGAMPVEGHNAPRYLEGDAAEGSGDNG